MGNKHLYLPNQTVNRLAEIDFSQMAARGITYVAIDVDGAQVQHGEVGLSDATINYLNHCQARGYIRKICLASNRLSRNLSSLAENIGAEIYQPNPWWARKPQQIYFQRLLDTLSCPPFRAVMIGDRVVQDIFGGNRVGMTTVLVSPLGTDVLLGRLVFRRRGERHRLRSKP